MLQGRIAYRRIPTGLPHTDPFSGTYLAGFGPHGIEILLLTRKIDKGHEIVTARKLTGWHPLPPTCMVTDSYQCWLDWHKRPNALILG